MTAAEAREQLRPLVQAEVEERQAAGMLEQQLQAMEQLAASLAAHEERLDQLAYEHIDRLLDQAEAGRAVMEREPGPLPDAPVAAYPRQRDIVARLERELEELRSRGDAPAPALVTGGPGAADPRLKALERRIAMARVLAEFQEERLGRDEARQQLLSLVRGYARTPSDASGLSELDRRRTELEQRLAEIKPRQADSSALVEERINAYLQ